MRYSHDVQTLRNLIEVFEARIAIHQAEAYGLEQAKRTLEGTVKMMLEADDGAREKEEAGAPGAQASEGGR